MLHMNSEAYEASLKAGEGNKAPRRQGTIHEFEKPLVKIQADLEQPEGEVLIMDDIVVEQHQQTMKLRSSAPPMAIRQEVEYHSTAAKPKGKAKKKPKKRTPEQPRPEKKRAQSALDGPTSQEIIVEILEEQESI